MKPQFVFYALAISLLCVLAGCATLFERKAPVEEVEQAPPAVARSWEALGLQRLWGITESDAEVEVARVWIIDKYLFLEKTDHDFDVFDRHTGEYVFGLDVGTAITDEPTYYPDAGLLYIVAAGTCFEVDLINRRVPRKLDLEFAAATGPGVDLKNLYFGTDQNRLCVMDRKGAFYKAGRTVDSAIHSTPVVGDNAVYFGCNDGIVYGVQRFNLKIVRAFPTGAPVTANVILEDNLVYACSQDYFVYCIPTVKPSLGKSDYVWKVSLESAIDENPVSVGPNLYVKTVSNGVFALSKDDGGRILWHVPDGRKLLCAGRKSAYVLLEGQPRMIALVNNDDGAIKEKIDVSQYDSFVANDQDATLYLVSKQGAVLALREWDDLAESKP